MTTTPSVHQPASRRRPGVASMIAIWAVSLLVAAGVATGIAYKSHSRLRSVVAAVKSALFDSEVAPIPVIQTGLYNLWAQEVEGPFEGRDGGIASVGEGLLVASRTGKLWYVGSSDGMAREIDFRVPIDEASFIESVGHVPGVRPDTFGLKDIAVQPLARTFRLFAGYPHWDREGSCVTFRVAQTEIAYAALTHDEEAGQPSWSVIYETEPCINSNITDGTFAGLQQAGGRIVLLDDERLLVSIGDYFNDGLNGPSFPQSLDNSYGKTVIVGLNGEPAQIYSFGHRNGQGLTVADNGDVFLTEHGPQGGDELNRVRPGIDYGWPQVIFGTDYGTLRWPANKTQGRHDGFEQPVFAWVPSIGVSNLISVSSPLFPAWRGDLLVASLTARTLFRVHLFEGRAVLVEPISIGRRIRDIAEGWDGSIVLKTDDNRLLFLRPAESYTRMSEGTDLFKGRLIAAQCSGCHSLQARPDRDLAPTLAGLIGRRIASVDGYAYSEGLKALDGSWTPQLLREFLREPSSVAKGTTMLYSTTLTEQDVIDLTSYLDTVD